MRRARVFQYVRKRWVKGVDAFKMNYISFHKSSAPRALLVGKRRQSSYEISYDHSKTTQALLPR